MTPTPIDAKHLSYVEALHHGGPKLSHDLGVLHETGNSGSNPSGAEDIQHYFAVTIGDRVASAHCTFDNNSAAQSVPWDLMAWHAPGANHDGWGFEHWAPYQAPPEFWLSQYAQDMLEISADVVAQLFELKGIPAVWCDEAALITDHRGLTDHATVTRAFRRGDHYDGIYMPKTKYIEMLRHRLGTGHDPDPVGPWPALHVGDGFDNHSPELRPWVRKLQVMLDQHPRIRLKPTGWTPTNPNVQHDGLFGKQTAKAVLQFKVIAHLPETPNVGQPTWRALKLAINKVGLTDVQRHLSPRP